MSSIKNTLKTGNEIAPSEISMLADDLAGACDTGIEFLSSLGQVTVMVDSDDPDLNTENFKGLVVWNTESRDLTATEAYEKVKRASQSADKEGIRVLFKKTDSAFRGIFGHEISAVMDAFNLKLCCVAPAIPEFGRVTRNGIQYLDGKPISESFYKNDPRHPVRDSNVLNIASTGHSRSIGLLALDVLRSSENERHLRKLLDSKTEIVVSDGEFQEDLNRSVDLFIKLPNRMVFVGGQDLGAAVARHCASGSGKGNWLEIPQGPILVVCGTLHPRSREQLAVFSNECDIKPVLMVKEEAAKCGGNDYLPEKTIANLIHQIEKYQIAVLASPENVPLDPDLVESSIAAAVKGVCDKKILSGLLLTGGTTAHTACRRIGIKSVQLRERIASGTVMAQVPEFNGMAICNKGGSLGEPDALVRFVKKVQSLGSL